MPDFYNRVCRKATNELICFTLLCCAISRIIYASRKKKCAIGALLLYIILFCGLGLFVRFIRSGGQAVLYVRRFGYFAEIIG